MEVTITAIERMKIKSNDWLFTSEINWWANQFNLIKSYMNEPPRWNV